MAKKRVKKNKKSSRSKKTKASSKSKKSVDYGKKKLHLIFKNMILFLVVAIISFVLRALLGSALLKSFFFLVGVVFAFVAVAFLIVFLVLKSLKFVKRK